MSDLIDTKYFTRFEQVTKVSRTDRGILAKVDSELLRIDVIRDDLMRVKISRGEVFDEEPTFAVQAALDAVPPVFNVTTDAETTRITTGQMVLTLWRQPFRLDAHRSDGSTIFESYQDQDGNYWGYATLNDTFVIRRNRRQEDAFFGLGEKTGHFNRSGRDFTLWNTDVQDPNTAGVVRASKAPGDPRGDKNSTEYDPYYVSIPFFYHMPYEGNKMAGLFIDNGYRGNFEFNHQTNYALQFEGGQYSEYIFASPTMPEILQAYTWLTGRMQPPPLWSLGYHQCRWHNYTQANIEALAARHREKQIPCDALWLDIDYMDGYRVFTWNEEAYPDVAGMLNRLSEQGFRAITIVDPGVKYDPGYWVFDQALERDVLCKTEGGAIYLGQVWPGKTAFPDFVTEEGRAWWGELNAAHVQSGLAGIWNDMNEPATGDIPSEAMRFGKGRYTHARYHNQYAMLMAMGTTDGLLKAMPDKRTFVLSRAGFAGIQRYAANWMGDNLSNWEHLWLSMPMAMGFGVSGQPFVGADIGGFMGNSNAELFTRWIQYGTLTAFCRNHSVTDTIEQYAWAFGEVVEELARQAINLRYRLLPYIYAAFIAAAESGEPIQQPLIFAFQEDRSVRDIDDEYLFGRQLLVAPVYKAGTTARQVYLPEGKWYHWHTGEEFAGKRFILASTPMEYIPLYARGGSIIPLWPDSPLSTDGYHPEVIELQIFLPAEDGAYHSVVYEDDGLTFKFRDGAYYRTDLTLDKSGPRLTIEATVTGNGYAEFARQAFHLIFHGGSPATVQVNEKTIAPQAGRFVVPDEGQGFQLETEV